MLAGRVEHDGRSYRIKADYPALARVAAAASLGITGPDGQAEVGRFMRHCIDGRDYPKYMRNDRHNCREYLLGAKIIAAINAAAARSADPEMREWARDFRAAIVEFRAGQTDAFQRLAYSNALKWGADV